MLDCQVYLTQKSLTAEFIRITVRILIQFSYFMLKL